MLHLKPQYDILHFINILLSLNICTFWDTEIYLHPHPIFSALSNLNFLTSETQKFNFNKLLPHALSPTLMNQKSPKDPKLILILTIKLLCTYFWKILLIGALIWLALIWLIWAQIAQPTSNHLKSTQFEFGNDHIQDDCLLFECNKTSFRVHPKKVGRPLNTKMLQIFTWSEPQGSLWTRCSPRTSPPVAVGSFAGSDVLKQDQDHLLLVSDTHLERVPSVPTHVGSQSRKETIDHRSTSSRLLTAGIVLTTWIVPANSP